MLERSLDNIVARTGRSRTEAEAMLKAGNPQKRFIQTREIAVTVAWLCSEEAGHVSGQVIRAMTEKLWLMQGWTEAVTIDNNSKRWDATKLGDLFATEVFKTRATGLRLGG